MADVMSSCDDRLDSGGRGSEDSRGFTAVLPIPPGLPTGRPPSADERLAAYSVLLQRLDADGAWATAEDLFSALSSHSRQLFPQDAFSVWLHDPSDRMLRLAMMAAPDRFALPMAEVPLDFGPGGRVMQTQEPDVRTLDAGPMPPIIGLLRRAGFGVLGIWPISTPHRKFGVLGIASVGDRYTPDIETTVERIADRIAEWLERCPPRPSVPDRWRSGEDRTQLLLQLTNALTHHRHLPDLLQAISSKLSEVIPHHYASLSLWDEQAHGLRRWAVVQPDGTAAVAADGELLATSEPPYVAFASGEFLEFSRGEIEAYDAPITRQLVAGGLRSGICVPLRTSRGKYGVLNVGSQDEEAFPFARMMLVWQIAGQLALAIENATTFDRAESYRVEASAQRDRYKLLLDINNALVSQLEAPALWTSIFEAVRGAIDHDFASVSVLDPVSRVLHVEMATYYDTRGVFTSTAATSLDRTPATLAVQWTSPCVFTGDELDQFDVAGLPPLRASGMRTLCVVPLAARGGVLGTLNVAGRDARRFHPDDIELLRDIGRQVAIAVDNTLAFRDISELKNRLDAEKVYLESEIAERDFKDIIGASDALQRVLNHVQTVAPTDSTVLLLGETGTGKELLARAIHRLSQRRDRAFIRFNGAALPADLVESELFGYERGAFTGATQAKPGRLELAHRGTFFLDEAGDVPLDVQPKLLRALQEREFERLGSTATRTVDIRLIAATNRNLEAMVADGAFRSDLFYRLSVFPIDIPPLRERPDDIPPLVHHFVRKFSRAMGRSISSIPRSTMDALQRWHWPGNIRELQNVIERAVILSKGTALHLPTGAIRTSHVTSEPRTSGSAFRDTERRVILNALRESHGVVAGPEGAAARLGLKRTTLHSKMQKLGIRRPGF